MKKQQSISPSKMEFQHLSISIFFAFIFLLMFSKFIRPKNIKNTTTKLPPGPWKLPLIGNLHQLLSPLPHRTLRTLATKYGPLMQLHLGEVPTVVVSSPDIAKQILKVHDVTFSQRPYLLASKVMCYNYTDIAFAPYGGYWRQMRKICTLELLSAKRVRSFASVRENEVKNLVETIFRRERSSMNLSELIYPLLYGITARAMFGNKCDGQEVFMVNMTKVMELSSGFCVADMYPSSKVLEWISGVRIQLEKHHKETDRILLGIVDKNRRRRVLMAKTGEGMIEENLVDVLLKLQEEGDLEYPLDDDNIKAVIMEIFSAGSESTATAIEWAMSELLRNPKLMNKAQTEVRQVFDPKRYVDETGVSELKFLKSVVKETLRLHPSGPLALPRECSEDCVINGYYIPAKTKVIVNVWAIGRDPVYWNEPESFNPERFLKSSIDYKGSDFCYLPFGGGRRICPGISFAIASVEFSLANLLYYFDWKLPGGVNHEDLDMTEAFGLSVRRKTGLVVIPVGYCPPNGIMKPE